MNVSEFIQSNLVLVFFVYGLSFFVLGIVLILPARTLIRSRSLGFLWLLAAFAITHGLAEWGDMAALLQSQTGGGQVNALNLATLMLTAASFTFLMQFGICLLYSQRSLPYAFLAVPVLLLVIWGILIFSDRETYGGIGDIQFLNHAQVLLRYGLGFPGALISAIALWKAGQYYWGTREPIGFYLMGGAISFLVYSVLTGLVVPPAPFFPANLANYETFLAIFGFPVQLGRAFCAVMVTFFLYQAYVVETSREQALMIGLVTSLNEGLRAVASELNLDATLDLIVRNARSLLGTDVSFLSLASPDGKELVMVASSGVRTEGLKQLRLSTSQGIAGKAILEKGPVTTENILLEPDLIQPLKGVIRDEAIVSGIANPLMDSNGLIGVLYVFNRKQTNFRTSDVEILSTFAGQAGVAIEHSRLYEQLAQEQKLLSLIIDTLPAGVVYVESAGGRIIANDVAREYLGHKEGEVFAIPGPEFAAFRASGERYPEEELPLARSLLRGELCSAEEVMVKSPDGKITNLLINCAPILDPERKVAGAVTAFVDITRLKELERLREEFLSVVAHDLRSPITVISGYASLLERLPEEMHGSELERRAIEVILGSTKRLNRMVTDLLDAGRIEAERLSLEKQLIDLVELARDTVERTREISAGHSIRLEVEETIPPVNADAGRIEQCLTNLLSNATKYSFPDTPIDLGIKRLPNEVQISVSNQGPGISTEDRVKLFSRFYRAGAESGEKVPGLGLGLYITRGLVEAHGGRIWVESEPGERTTFYFTLPLEGNHRKN